MSDLLTSAQQRTKAPDGRIWSSEPIAAKIAAATIRAKQHAQAVKFIGLVALGWLGWFIAGPILSAVAAIAWFVIGFRCTDAYYSGWLEGTLGRLGKEAELEQRLASTRRLHPEAASLIDSAKGHHAEACRRSAADGKGSFGDMAVNALTGAVLDGIAAAHWIAKGEPLLDRSFWDTPPNACVQFEEIGLSEYDWRLYLTLCNASTLEIPKAHFDFLADAVAAFIGRVERL